MKEYISKHVDMPVHCVKIVEFLYLNDSDSKISLRRHILSYHTKEIDFGKMKNILSKSCEKTSSDMDTNKGIYFVFSVWLFNMIFIIGQSH